MAKTIGTALRAGVLLSATVIALGTALLVTSHGTQDASVLLAYDSARVPHGGFDPSLFGMAKGLLALDAYSIIELGLLVLLATPVVRVLLSVLLFALERDRTYVYITVAVFSLLLFSMLVTPFIPHFNG